MKKILKSSSKAAKCLALIVMVCALVLPAVNVYAYADDPVLPKSDSIYLYKDKNENSYDYKIPKKVISVKSSNKSVATIKKIANNYVRVVAKKQGTTTLVVNAKGTTYQCKLNVVKYKNPFKTVKVGGTNFTSKFNKVTSDDYDFKSLKKKMKISVKCNSGFTSLKIKKMDGSTFKIKACKNNSTIKFNEGDIIILSAKDKRTGKRVECHLMVFEKWIE